MRESERAELYYTRDLCKRVSERTGYSEEFVHRNMMMMISAVKERLKDADKPTYHLPGLGRIYLKPKLLYAGYLAKIGIKKLDKRFIDMYHRFNKILYLGFIYSVHFRNSILYNYKKWNKKDFIFTDEDLENIQNGVYEKSN